MTSEAQRQANRANASKSTGPRTAEGRQHASQNALRHGLSRPPPRSHVMAWYEAITGTELNPASVPRTDEDSAALELAEAEAHLANAVREEERFLESLDTGENLAVQLRRVREIIKEVWRSIPGTSPEVERILLARRGHVPHKITHTIKETWTLPHVRHGRLARYRKAAEVRRHKALQAWIKTRRHREETPERTQILSWVVSGRRKPS